MARTDRWTTPPQQSLLVTDRFRLADLDPGSRPGWEGGKKAAAAHTVALGAELSELQELLFADGRTGGSRSVLLVLQGMDTSGKGGIVRHVVGMVDPQGVSATGFAAPTREELSHHYLWRIRKALPRPGRIGVFDRSHYEDVLVTRVHGLVSAEECSVRYTEINDFEAELVAAGTTVLKVTLVISPEEQAARLRRRLERPDKHWKFSPSDIDEREHWSAYAAAYQAVFDRTSTAAAPWYAVPADSKWYARLAVADLLAGALRQLGLDWPVADFDPAEQLARLDASRPT